MRLVLASASPRRKELLAQAGFAFEVRVAGVDESRRVGEAPEAYVRRLALEKASAVLRAEASLPVLAESFDALDAKNAKLRQGCLDVATGGCGADAGKKGQLPVVLGADTTVVLDGEVMNKPLDRDDAERMLRMLSGRTHQVHTGVAVVCPLCVLTHVETTNVVFREIGEAELRGYLDSGDPLDKAGAYGIQGYAARWIPRIEGDYFNVVGLPISAVVRLLGECVERR